MNSVRDDPQTTGMLKRMSAKDTGHHQWNQACSEISSDRQDRFMI
jgi:hypothetical protein